MKEAGYMYGLNGSYTYQDEFSIVLQGRLSAGQVDYTDSGTKNDINN